MQIKKGLFEIKGFLNLNCEIILFAFVAIKKFNKELIIRVNKEINAPEYPKAKADINNTGVTIPFKDDGEVFESVSKGKFIEMQFHKIFK